jgi:3-methyl-2-oxobutanoate hydroxymethyltransferase
MVVLGYENTIPVTLADILHHTRAVVRGSRRALIVADMPFMTYHRSMDQALENAGRCIQEGGAQAVKLEGGRVMAETIGRLVAVGIPVLGHIGLTPQSVHQLGGFKVQGKTLDAARRLVDDAHAVEGAGAFAVVLECIPAEVARLITERLSIPTIGIGAGPFCDAEIQVSSDILGWLPDFTPKHTRPYAQLAHEAAAAFRSFQEDVAAGSFPTAKESFSVPDDVLVQLRKEWSPTR